MDDAVDEERRRSGDLAGRLAAFEVALDTREGPAAAAVALELRFVEAEFDGVLAKVAFPEGVLRWKRSSCISQKPPCNAAASTALAAASACGWISVSGKCRNANLIPPGCRRSTCSIARNACREYGHS